jgi:hypothetical protein
VSDTAPPAEEETGAVATYDAASATQPDDAQHVPWRKPPPRAPPSSSMLDEEPRCLHDHLLWTLMLRWDLPVHFIDTKVVTGTDLDAHQNRFRLPTNGVLQRLLPLLTLEELEAANLLYDPEPRAKQLPPPPGPDKNGAADAANESSSSQQQQAAGEKKKKKKKRGRVHGGLPVRLVDLAAGFSWELQMSRWESSHGTVVQGEGYLDFIRRCSFKQGDVVEMWAFKQHQFRNFRVTMCRDSILHLFIVKRHDAPTTCRYCPLPVKRAMRSIDIRRSR